MFLFLKRRVKFLIVLLAVLNAWDVFSTLFFINNVGFYEANPIARFLLQQGNSTFVICKLGLSALFIALAVYMKPEDYAYMTNKKMYFLFFMFVVAVYLLLSMYYVSMFVLYFLGLLNA